MTARSRMVLLAGALVALAAFFALREWNDSDGIGMTETPCAANGGPVTGKAKDDWARLCAYRRANAELLKAGSKPAIVMIGDSITAFWPAGDKSIVSRGVGGQTSAQVLLRFRQDAVALEPRIVHILVGINDVAGNQGPVSPGMFENNIRAMVELAEAHDIDVILGTIPPARGFHWAPDADPGRWVPILNQWLARYADEKGIVLADYHAALSYRDGRIRDDLFGDGVHPNKKGYVAMTRVLSGAIGRSGKTAEISGPHRPKSPL